MRLSLYFHIHTRATYTFLAFDLLLFCVTYLNAKNPKDAKKNAKRLKRDFSLRNLCVHSVLRD